MTTLLLSIVATTVAGAPPNSSIAQDIDRLNYGILFQSIQPVEAKTAEWLSVYNFVIDFNVLQEPLRDSANDTTPLAVRQILALLYRMSVEHRNYAKAVLRDIKNSLPDMSPKARASRGLCGGVCADFYFRPFYNLASIGDISRLQTVIEDSAKLQQMANSQFQTGLHSLSSYMSLNNGRLDTLSRLLQS